MAGIYRVEAAKTARAKCNGPICKKEVNFKKGELKLGTWIEPRSWDHGFFIWKHWGEVTPQIISNIKGTIGDDLGCLDGYTEFPDEYIHYQDKIRATFEQGHVDDDEWMGVPEYNRLGMRGMGKVIKKEPKDEEIKEEKPVVESDDEEYKPKAKKGKAKKAPAKKAASKKRTKKSVTDGEDIEPVIKVENEDEEVLDVIKVEPVAEPKPKRGKAKGGRKAKKEVQPDVDNQEVAAMTDSSAKPAPKAKAAKGKKAATVAYRPPVGTRSSSRLKRKAGYTDIDEELPVFGFMEPAKKSRKAKAKKDEQEEPTHMTKDCIDSAVNGNATNTGDTNGIDETNGINGTENENGIVHAVGNVHIDDARDIDGDANGSINEDIDESQDIGGHVNGHIDEHISDDGDEL